MSIGMELAFMIEIIAVAGVAAGSLLVALLAAGLGVTGARSGRLRIWPAEAASWQSFLFWGLFRTVNVATLALSWLLWQPLIEHAALRWAALGIAAILAIAYVWACISLGRANLYCGTAGLVIDGVYAWSRNPQYAIAMPAYLMLAAAVQSPTIAVLAALLVGVFWLMASNEEPWLEATYGDAYRRYRSQVPRFYNLRRAVFTVWPDPHDRPAGR